MHVEMWPIERVKPYDRNPRQNDGGVEAVARSLREFGFRQPLVVDEAGVVVVGHTRLKAAQSLGMVEVPVHVASGLTPEQARAYRIADNQTSNLSAWDYEKLRLEAVDLEALGVDLDLLGFGDAELAEIMARPAGELGDPEEISDPPKEPTTRPGDLWKLGKHRLLCGDSTVATDVDRLMGGEKADMLLTDPPYGVSYVGKTKDALVVENDDMKEVELTALVSEAFGHAERVSRGGAYWYATVPAGPLHILFAEDWKHRGILRQIMVWVKDSMVLGHSEYHYQHEPILFGWIPNGERHRNSDRTRTTVWKCERPKASREHPTMKPVALWAQAIEDGSRGGENVYDPFLGSGTTLIACEQLNRRCFGMEISPAYCDVIVARWEKFTGGKAELEARDG